MSAEVTSQSAPHSTSNSSHQPIHLSDQVKILLFAPKGEAADKIRKAMHDSGSTFTISLQGKGRCLDVKKGALSVSEEERVQTHISVNKLILLLKNSRENHPYVEMGFDAVPLHISSSL